jgi:hypothetical protein
MSRVVMFGRVTSRVVLISWLRQVLPSAAVICLIGACSSAPPPSPAAPPAATAAPVASEPPTCVDAKDQRVQCLADSDCCPRFVCGKDPELSQSVNYCVFGG